MKILKKLLGAALGIAALAAPIAHAGSITFFFGNNGVFSGDVPVATSDVYATAKIDWTNDTKTAQILMSVGPGLPAGAYVSDWFFNLAAGNIVTGATFIGDPLTQKTDDFTQFGAQNAYSADGGGYFDLHFAFINSAHDLQNGESSLYEITTQDNLSATAFDDFSVHKKGQGWVIDPREIQAAVKVQGYTLPTGGSGSAWLKQCADGENCDTTVIDVCTSDPSLCVDVPEPASLAILGTGLLGIAFARGRKAKK